MFATLLPALEQQGRLNLGKGDHDPVLPVSGATIDRVLGDVKVAASGGLAARLMRLKNWDYPELRERIAISLAKLISEPAS